MSDDVAKPGRGWRALPGAAALAAALGVIAGAASAQQNPSTADDFQGGSGHIESPTGEASAQGGAAVPAITYYESPRTMFATTSSRVRSGPGTGHEPVGTIPYGAEVAVLGEAPDGNWVYLEMGDGVRGFTAGRLLSASAPAAGGAVTGGGQVNGAAAVPTCISGEVLIDLGNGQSICALLQ